MSEVDTVCSKKANLRGKNRKIRLEQVYDKENLEKADHNARKGKKEHKGVKFFDSKREKHLESIHEMLKNHTYHTSEGHECIRKCPCGKERLLHKLPYYPDHIIHHALMQILMPTLMKSYFYDSSASIKGRGMHYAAKRLKRYIDENKDAGRLYYAKLDFVKFYHNINQEKIYDRICKKFSDEGIRYLLKEVITACDTGLGIGLYPIQPLANYYTGDLCRELSEKFDIRLFIYCDDMVIIGRNKKEIWKAVNFVQDYAKNVMEQPLHTNIGVQIVDETRGVDFVGYKFFFNHTLLRKRMKNKFKEKMRQLKDPMRKYQVLVAYKGWLMHCNGYKLWMKVTGMKRWSDIQIPEYVPVDKNGKRILEGKETSANVLAGEDMAFLDCEDGVETCHGKDKMYVLVEKGENRFKFCTGDPALKYQLNYAKDHNMFPLVGKLVAYAGGKTTKYKIE